MLTLTEVLSDATAALHFNDTEVVGVNSRGENGQSPLHWMAILGDAKGVHLLIEADANINATDNRGNTPLHEAITSRQVLAAGMLITYGANIHIKNNEGKTPFDLAEADGFKPTVELLQSVQS